MMAVERFRTPEIDPVCAMGHSDVQFAKQDAQARWAPRQARRDRPEDAIAAEAIRCAGLIKARAGTDAEVPESGTRC